MTDKEWQIDILAVSGAALANLTADKELEGKLLYLLSFSRSCVFVRMSPSQKAQVLELAQIYLNMTVLAIGDGYNDT